MISGRAVDEKAVLTYYDSATERPRVKRYGVELSDANHSAVVGVRFSATPRDPAAGDFVGLTNVVNLNGFYILGGYGNSILGDVLIEDCWFAWFAGNSVQTAASPSVLLEENIFDHNGWYRQAFSGSTKTDAVATMFNHNTDFAESRNTICHNNIFIRSSSIQNKFTSNTTSGINPHGSR